DSPAILSTPGNGLSFLPASLSAEIATQTLPDALTISALGGIAVTLGGVVNGVSVTDWNGTSTPINDAGNVAATLASLSRTAGENVAGSPYSITGGSLNALTRTAAGNYPAHPRPTGHTPTITP